MRNTIAGLALLVGLSSPIKAETFLEAFDKASNIKYVDDQVAHGVLDYWQTARETKLKGTGDCEDSAYYLMSLLDKDEKKNAEFKVGFMDLTDRSSLHAWVEYTSGSTRVIADTTAGMISNRKHLPRHQYVPITNWADIPEFKKLKADRTTRELYEPVPRSKK